ncbi:DnaJ -like protein subfamily C member 7 [Halotydeus destructor]|nr:DnaJ -like protein subfamily C member 7 [Halotydeus destructor]
MEEASKGCERTLETSHDVDHVLLRAAKLLQQKMYKEATKEAILARKLEPGNIGASILLAECHQAYGNFVLAERVLQLASSHDDNKIQSLLRSLKKMRLDEIRIRELYLEKEFTDANTLCSELLLTAPECRTAMIFRCLCLTMMGQHEQAEILADNLLEANPWDNEALFARAQLLYYAEKYDEANVIFDQILVCPLAEVRQSAKYAQESLANFVRANELAHAALKKKEYGTAIQRFEDILMIDVNHKLGNAKIHLILCMIHNQLRNLFKALDHCELARQLVPTNGKAISKHIDLLERLTFIDEALEQTKRSVSQSDDKVDLILHLEKEQSLAKSQGHYFVLSVSPKATEAEILAAYEEKKSHFASCDTLVAVKDKTKLKRLQVDEAYSVLKDRTRRSLYDQKIGISKRNLGSSDSDNDFLAEIESIGFEGCTGASLIRGKSTSVADDDSESKSKFVSSEQQHKPETRADNDGDNFDTHDNHNLRSRSIVDENSKIDYECQPPERNQNDVKAPEANLSYNMVQADWLSTYGEQLYDEGDFQIAIQAFTEAIFLHPTFASYYASRCVIYSRMDKYPEALNDAATALELDSENTEAICVASFCHMILGNIVEAENYLKRLEPLDPRRFRVIIDKLDDLKLLVHEADTEFAYGNFRATIDTCNIILERFPEYSAMKLLRDEALALLNDVKTVESNSAPEPNASQNEALRIFKTGVHLLEKEQYAEAAEKFSEAIALFPTDVDFYSNRSLAYSNIGKYKEALDDAETALELDGEKVEVLPTAVHCCFILGKLVQAEEYSARLKTIVPDSETQAALEFLKTEVNLAEAKLADSNFRTTVRICDSILERCPLYAEIKLLKAEALARLNDFEPAQEIIADLIDNPETQAGVVYIRGLLAYYKDDFDIALKLLANIQTKYPEHVKSRKQAEEIRLLKRRKEEGNEAFKASLYDKACAKYTEALSIDRTNKLTNAKLHLNRSKARFTLGKTNEARLDCDQAVILNPKYVKAYLKRAEIHTKLKMYDEAVTDWETVRELDASVFDLPSLNDVVKKLTEVERDPWAVLGISATATLDQIRQARNRLALIHHPDKHQARPSPIRRMHERKFKAIQEAFEAMMNSDQEDSD